MAPNHKFMAVISNPCMTSQTLTCQRTKESDLLENSIFKQLYIGSGMEYFSTHTLKSDVEYSYQINTLNPNKLYLTCWNLTDFSGSILYKDGQAFSSNYTYLASYRSCRWEGFLSGLTSGDLEFSISGESDSKLWIKYDSYPVINYTCCNSESYRMRINTQLYYYIRLDLYHSTQTLNTNLTYKILPAGTEQTIPVANMYQPIRISMGVLIGNLNITYNVVSNIPEGNFYYCPLLCTSCLFSFAGTKCTGCIDGAELVDNVCKCINYKNYYYRTSNCENYPPLSKRCVFSYDSMLCDKCVENASILDKYCECVPGYYEDSPSNSCKPNSNVIDVILNKTNQYEYVDSLLEIFNPCAPMNGILCEETSSNKILGTRKLIKFTDLPSSISAIYEISENASYSISILNLRSGSFLLETFPSSNWTGIPVSSASPLKFNLANTLNKSFRLQGYLKFTENLIYTFYISSNTSCKIYFDFLSNPWAIPETSIGRVYHLVANKYYYLRIDFLGIASGNLSLNFNAYINGTSKQLEGDSIYYADSSTISRWDIHSSDSSLYTTSYKNGLRYCPILCASCHIRLNRTAGANNEICDKCIDNAAINSEGKCFCERGYYQEADIEKCSECPNACISCRLNSGIIECDSCIEHGIVESGKCICSIGYYLDVRSSLSCNKCPNTCTSCTLTDGVIECKSCIENGIVLTGNCECKSGYYLESASSVQCKKCPGACSTCKKLDENVICESCIEHAWIDQNDCRCNTGYFLSTSFPIACYKIGEYCINFELLNAEIICTSCIDNAKIVGNGCTCNDMYYGDTSEKDVCLKCPSPCNTCKKSYSQIICKSCISGYYLSNIDPGKCMQCPLYCAECIENDGQVICNKCLDMLILHNNQCMCESGYGIDTSSVTCKKCPELSYRCEYNDSLITDLICKENTFKLDNNCYCEREYYSNGICTPFECKVDIIIENISKPTLLHLIEDCRSDDKIICKPPYMSRTKLYSKESLSLLSERDYYLYTSELDMGGLSFKYWNSSDIRDDPVIYKKEDLRYDLSEYKEGLVRFEGYINFPCTGIIEFIIDTNSFVTIYLQDDRNILNYYTSIDFRGYFTQGEYYFIRIELPIVADIYIKLYGYNYDLYFEISSDNLYYPKILSNYSTFIPSTYCNQTEPLNPLDDSSGHNECPKPCNKCEESNAADKNVICSECVNTEYSPESMCRCRIGLIYDLEYERCYIPYCSEYNENEICLECLGYFILKDGGCICEGEDFEMLNDLCTPKEFSLSIDTQTSKISLLFSKYLRYNLNKNDITINIQDSQISKLLTYEFETIIEKLSYLIEFKYPKNIDTQLSILLWVSPSIIDRESTTLSKSFYNITLHLLSQNSNDNTSQEVNHISSQVNEHDETSLESTAAVASATIVLSLTNLNPNVLLSMLTTLQIFSLVPLMNIELSSRIKGVCSGFNIINIYPNLMKYIIPNDGNEMNERYYEYGYTTSQFFINSGEQITILITICCLFIFINFLDRLLFRRSSDCRIKKVVSRVKESFVFGVFIGFIMQGYLEFLITSGLNINYLEYSSIQQIINFSGACVTFVRYI
jgi:hypothetical protein